MFTPKVKSSGKAAPESNSMSFGELLDTLCDPRTLFTAASAPSAVPSPFLGPPFPTSSTHHPPPDAHQRLPSFPADPSAILLVPDTLHPPFDWTPAVPPTTRLTHTPSVTTTTSTTSTAPQTASHSTPRTRQCTPLAATLPDPLVPPVEITPALDDVAATTEKALRAKKSRESRRSRLNQMRARSGSAGSSAKETRAALAEFESMDIANSPTPAPNNSRAWSVATRGAAAFLDAAKSKEEKLKKNRVMSYRWRLKRNEHTRALEEENARLVEMVAEMEKEITSLRKQLADAKKMTGSKNGMPWPPRSPTACVSPRTRKLMQAAGGIQSPRMS